MCDLFRAKRAIARHAPDAALIFDDRIARPDLVLRKAAKSRGIPVALVPFAVSSFEADVFVRRHNSAHRVEVPPWRSLKRWIVRRWPDQVHADPQGGSLLFFGPFDTLVLAACGMLPARPWVLGGSDPDVICAASVRHRSYLLSGGVAAERIVVTGQPSLDRLATAASQRARLRTDLVTRYRLPTDGPFVVCAVPQYAEHGMASWSEHKVLTEDLFAALGACGAAVLLSLHPKSRRDTYADAAARYGLKILEERLAAALPAADLLVGTFSSTVAWAVGLGIPAMVVDSIRSGYQLYRDIEGVLVVDSHAELGAELARFVGDIETRNRLTRSSIAGAAELGVIDGEACRRVLTAIEREMSAKFPERNTSAVAGMDGALR